MMDVETHPDAVDPMTAERLHALMEEAAEKASDSGNIVTTIYVEES